MTPETQSFGQHAGVVVNRGGHLIFVDGEYEELLTPHRACALCWDMVTDYKFIGSMPYCTRSGEYDVSCYDVVNSNHAMEDTTQG